jgi:acyl-CoA thioester hydrolase
MKPVSDTTPAILHSQSVIRFQDCDPYSHLNNGAYLDYFMNAREDQVLAAYDFDIYAYSRTTGMGWVVTQNQIAYIRPALLMETVHFESQLLESRPKFLDSLGKLKSLLWAQFIHVDIAASKSVPHSEELQAIFDHVQRPVTEKDFNERLRALNTP